LNAIGAAQFLLKYVSSKNIILKNLSMITREKSHAVHIRHPGLHFLHTAGGLRAVSPTAQVQDFELVGGRWPAFRISNIQPPHPIALFLQTFSKGIIDEGAGTDEELLAV
jgi:hypothetical protein